MNKKTGFFALLCLVFALIVVPINAQEIEPVFPPSAIINAAYRGDEKTVLEILALGCDKDVRDTTGATALHVAVFCGNSQVVKILLDYGFNPNAKTTRSGNTPLHNAVSANNLNAARLLLQYGALPGMKNLDGQSPIDKARAEDKRAMLNVLLR